MVQHAIALLKRSLTIATLSDQGALLARRRMPASRLEVRRYFKSWDGPQRAVAESTGSWYWLADLCSPPVQLADLFRFPEPLLSPDSTIA